MTKNYHNNKSTASLWPNWREQKKTIGNIFAQQWPSGAKILMFPV